VNSIGLKLLGEGEWKRKKRQPEYRRQWWKCILGLMLKSCKYMLFNW